MVTIQYGDDTFVFDEREGTSILMQICSYLNEVTRLMILYSWNMLISSTHSAEVPLFVLDRCVCEEEDGDWQHAPYVINSCEGM